MQARELMALETKLINVGHNKTKLKPGEPGNMKNRVNLTKTWLKSNCHWT